MPAAPDERFVTRFAAMIGLDLNISYGTGNFTLESICTNRPDRRSLGRIAVSIGPGKSCTTPVLYVNAQVPLVPGTKRLRILRAEEYATNSSDSLHLILRIEPVRIVSIRRIET